MHVITSIIMSLVCSVCLFVSGAIADVYPAKPVTIIAPYSPGGTVDLVARLMAQKLSEQWGVQVVVENRTGAGGQIASQYVKDADPDGYTLLINTGIHVLTDLLYKDVTYRPIEDFAPISHLGEAPLALVVPGDSEFKTLGEIISYAEANPGSLTYGHTGLGAASQMSGAALQDAANVELFGVPYRGGADALAALMGGQIDINFNVIPEVLGQLNQGTVKAIAVTSPDRLSLLPEVPSFSETLPGFEFSTWWVILGPNGLPQHVIDKANEGLISALKDPEVVARLETLSIKPTGTSPDQAELIMRTYADHWKRIFSEAGIQPQ